jgi:biopolymer transport protein ExbB
MQRDTHPFGLIAGLTLALLAAPAGAAGLNIVAQLQEGGIPLLAILGLSVLFLAVTIERLLHLRAVRVVPAGLAERVLPLWAKGEFAAIENAADASDSTLGRAIRFIVAHRRHDYAQVSGGAGDIASLELRHHQQKFYALSIVATVAPIVGLLGTVIGMIEAFHVIAYSEGMGNPALLAGGISMALVNTAAGLCVALPALAMHHYLKHRTAFLGMALERDINRLLHAWLLPREDGSANLHVVGHAH